MTSNKIPNLNAIEELCRIIREYIDSVTNLINIKSYVLSNIQNINIGTFKINENSSTIENKVNNKSLKVFFDTEQNTFNIQQNITEYPTIWPVREPTSPNEVANKQYVDQKIAQASSGTPLYNVNIRFNRASSTIITSNYSFNELINIYQNNLGKIRLQIQEQETQGFIYTYINNYSDAEQIILSATFTEIYNDKLITKIVYLYEMNNELTAKLETISEVNLL